MYCSVNSCLGAGIVIMAGLKLAASCVVLGMYELAEEAVRNKLATYLAMHQEEVRAFNIRI